MKKRHPIALQDVPLILSKWRRLEHSGIPSDRELVGALKACVAELNEKGAFGEETGKWAQAVGK